MQNVQGTLQGALAKRDGLVTFATPPVQLNSLFALEETGPFLVASGATSIYSISTGGTVTPIKTGLTNNLNWEFVQSQPVTGPPAQGPLYGMNGVDTPQTWSGTGSMTNWTATTGTVPNGKYMLLAGNRIWVSGVSANPSRVYFSDLIPVNNGPVTWPTANVSIFDENDGHPITGLGHVGPYILVFKANKTFVIVDLNTGDARRLSDSIGCVSHRSIAAAPEGTYFLCEMGVYRTNGSSLQSLSDTIIPTLGTIQDQSQAAGAYFNNHYYLSVDLSGTYGLNDTTLDYDVVLSSPQEPSWWLHTFGSSQFATWHPVGNIPLLYSAKDTAAIVDRCFAPGVNTDNGQPFTWTWKGPWQSPSFYRRRRFPTPYFRKRLRQLRIEGNGHVDVSLATDFFDQGEVLKQKNVFTSDDTTFGDSMVYGAIDGTIFGEASGVKRARLFSLGVANAFSVVFSNQFSVLDGDDPTKDYVFAYNMVVTDRRDLIQS
jgi:hypothetical protein